MMRQANAPRSVLLRILLLCLALCAGGEALAASELRGLLDQTGLKYMLSGTDTAVVLVKGQNATQVVTVRQVESTVAVFAEVCEVAEEDVPLALWRRAATANARPSLAHVGYVRAKSRFYALSGVPFGEGATGPVLRLMIQQVSGLADELQPVFRDLLRVE